MFKKSIKSIRSKRKYLAILCGLILALVLISMHFGVLGSKKPGSILDKFGAGQTSTFYSAQAWNLSNSAEKSDMIITGEVAEVRNAEWNTSSGERPEKITSEDIAGIHHEVVIDIEEVIKGPEKDRIELTVDTGQIGRYNVQSSSAAEYREGERVLVYVQKWKGHYQTFGQKYGKFNLDEEVISRDVNGPYKEEINLTRVIERQKRLYGSS